MANPADPHPELQKFLSENVGSYAQLDTLLLLRQRTQERLSAATVAELLVLPEDDVKEALHHLRLRHLVAREDNDKPLFVYQPRDAELARLVELLASAWAHERLSVMNLMSSNAIERVRSSALRTFSDAFLLRKKDRDG